MKQLKVLGEHSMQWRFIQQLPVIASIVFLFATMGCKKELTPADADVPSTKAALEAQATKSPNIVVHAGNSIQAAVDAAAPNSVIKIEPGIYLEAVVVNKPGISLIGAEGNRGQVIIKNPGTVNNGIMVRDAGDGFVLKNVTVQGFRRNGVILLSVDGFLLSGVSAIDNNEYGLFPIRSSNGVIENCKASGHADTGIYVGQSSNVTITQCEAFANVNGIEVENCSSVVVEKNKAYDNVVGIMSVLLPGLTVKQASDILISKNDVYNNNHANFAEEDELESAIPSGSGILIVGSDNTTVEKNNVTGNKFVGIAVVNTTVLGSLLDPPLPLEAFADIDPYPDGVRISKNTLQNNGYAPPAGLPFPGVDLLWDGTGNGNCWEKNTYASSAPATLPACH